MFDISENGKEAVVSYLNKAFKNRRVMEPTLCANISETLYPS
jgi:hypothetical protein